MTICVPSISLAHGRAAHAVAIAVGIRWSCCRSRSPSRSTARSASGSKSRRRHPRVQAVEQPAVGRAEDARTTSRARSRSCRSPASTPARRSPPSATRTTTRLPTSMRRNTGRGIRTSHRAGCRFLARRGRGCPALQLQHGRVGSDGDRVAVDHQAVRRDGRLLGGERAPGERDVHHERADDRAGRVGRAAADDLDGFRARGQGERQGLRAVGRAGLRLVIGPVDPDRARRPRGKGGVERAVHTERDRRVIGGIDQLGERAGEVVIPADVVAVTVVPQIRRKDRVRRRVGGVSQRRRVAQAPAVGGSEGDVSRGRGRDGEGLGREDDDQVKVMAVDNPPPDGVIVTVPV